MLSMSERNNFFTGKPVNTILVLLLFAISFVLVLSCTLSRTGISQETSKDQPPAKVIDEIEFTFVVDPVKTSSEPVKLELCIENRSADPKKLTFNSAQKYDFWVIDSSGSEVWRWSRDKSFLQIVEELQIPTAAKIAFIESFEIKDTTSGTYTAYGEVLTSPASILLSDRFEIKK